ncbi:MAG: DMT family transporter [Anaerolineae bacterium]|nr:DMT family transporter [Anaerolineae bacterium]
MNIEGQQQARAYTALAVGALALGFSPIFVRWANAPGLVSGFYRMSIASLLLLLPFLRARRAGPRPTRKALWLAIWAGLFFAGDLAAWMSGVMLAGVTNPTLLSNTAPLWVGLGAMAFLGEKLKPQFWGGLGLAFVGAVVILGTDLSAAAEIGQGSLFGLLSGAFYGGYFLFMQRAREKLNSLSSFWIAAATSALALLALSLAFKMPLSGYPDATYLAFAAMGLVTQVLGFMAITFALGHLPASIVSPTLLMQPVLAALLAGPLLGESISGVQVAGGAAVLAGVYLVHRSRREGKNYQPTRSSGLTT